MTAVESLHRHRRMQLLLHRVEDYANLKLKERLLLQQRAKQRMPMLVTKELRSVQPSISSDPLMLLAFVKHKMRQYCCKETIKASRGVPIAFRRGSNDG